MAYTQGLSPCARIGIEGSNPFSRTNFCKKYTPKFLTKERRQMKNIPDHIEKKVLYKNGCYYRTSCGCGCDNHISMSISEDDKEYGYFGLYFKATRCVYFWEGKWKALRERVSTAFRYLFIGRMELQEELIIKEPDHLRDIAKIFMGLADDLEEAQKANPNMKL